MPTGGPYTEEGFRITIDKKNNVYNLGKDWILYKYDQFGTLIWSKQRTGFPAPFNIATDKDGSLYTVGYFTGTVDFDLDPINTFYMTSNARVADMFIDKIDSLGNFQWAKSTNGNQIAVPYYISVFNPDEIFVYGKYANSLNFDSISLTGTYDVFITKTGNNLTNLNETKTLTGFSLFPNPVASVLNVHFDKLSSSANINILTMEGKSLYAVKYTVSDCKIDVSFLKSGIYTLQIQSDKMLENRKFVVIK